ncbi:glycoside hydrolase family 97 protein [Luteimonas sp. 100069]|uniref:glycoside hydrolase family 97 protein n=1 Tax=Luteimonas sp. 100069 TaxID=2006109 RepID=UPI000F4D93F1|nr:glycoside hydrolase family 97 protein [Luteimonas sp. 100069]RPD88821.1 glycoside hydrolase family 97 protein [Luteimonas sp. 100069]
MPNRFAGLLAALLPLAAFAAAADEPRTSARVASPDARVAVEVTTDNEGRASYAVSRDGRPVIAPSRLGMMFTDAPKFERNLAIVDQRTRTHDEHWELPWGERRHMRDHHNELRVTLAEHSGPKRRFDVVFRVFDDGIGFRYDIPAQPGLERLSIAEELTEFAVADAATAWWIPAFEWNREEYLYHRTPVEQVGQAQTPITLRTDGGLHLSIHEAALVDYSGMNLARVDGRRFRAALTPGLGAAKVVVAAPFATPWRTIQIGERAGDLVESQLILNLNAPNALGDVSWVRPMKYVGIWWEMHLDRKSWASGPKHGATTEHAIRHIDFAAANGFGGVLVEGWNVGWDGDWFGNGETFSFTTPYPDFDIEAVTRHARAQGVTLIGHHETSGHAGHYEAQLEDAMALYGRLGVQAVKTGYVADAGQAKVTGDDGRLHYAWHEGQGMVRHHQRVVEAAARHRISVNPHEPVKDTGLRRTWPNLVTREGARGMEYNAWGQPGNPPGHEATLVYTRLLAGPMDFTPGIFGMETRSGTPMSTTLAKQLALYVVIHSPLQMAADLLEHYESRPEAFQFVRDVPVDWDDTRAPAGEVGTFAVIARRARGGDDWYLGGVTDDDARVVAVALDFLDPARRYTAQIYRDGEGAGWRTDPHALIIETREVDAGDTLELAMASGGGQAVRFVAH